MNCYKVSNSVKIPLQDSVSSPASMTDINTKHQFQKKIKLPASLRDLYKEQCSNVDEIVESQMNKKLDRATLDLIESATRAQSSSLHWKSLRVGRITGSTVYDCVKGNVEAPSKSTVLKITCTGNSISKIPAVKWGEDHEQVALDKYTSLYTQRHKDFTVQRPGLRLHAEHNFIGASADGIATCSCHGSAVVEVKCTYKYKDAKELEHLSGYDCLTQDSVLKTTHKYYYQIQLQMLVYNVTRGHFVIWTPELTLIQEVKKNETFQNEMVEKLCRYFRCVIGPELVTRQLETRSVDCSDKENLKPLTNDESDGVACVCSGRYSGNRVIGCDSLHCDVGWYHKSCVKVKRTPKGKWYCSQCKKAMRKTPWKCKVFKTLRSSHVVYRLHSFEV